MIDKIAGSGNARAGVSGCVFTVCQVIAIQKRADLELKALSEKNMTRFVEKDKRLAILRADSQ